MLGHNSAGIADDMIAAIRRTRTDSELRALRQRHHDTGDMRVLSSSDWARVCGAAAYAERRVRRAETAARGAAVHARTMARFVRMAADGGQNTSRAFADFSSAWDRALAAQAFVKGPGA